MARADFAPINFAVPNPGSELPRVPAQPVAALEVEHGPSGAAEPAALDPTWRSGGVARQESDWAPGSAVAVYGAEGEVVRRRELLEQEHRLAELAARRRLEAKQLEAEIWADEIEDLGQLGSRARVRERTAREAVGQPVGLLEALLHPRGRGVLAAGVAAAAATKGLLALLGPAVEGERDLQREARARLWTGAALLAGLFGLAGAAQSVGASGVQADRRAVLVAAEARRSATAREHREAQRRHAGWIGA